MSKSTKKTVTKTYLFHELSSIFPLMEGEEFELLVEDMRLHGQQEIGILYEGKILDGRNRYRVCKILNIPFEVKDYDSDMDPRDYIISTNLYRRHLNVAQRSEIGLLLLEEEEKLAKERKSAFSKERPKKEDGTFLPINNQEDKKDYKSSTNIVAPKVRIGSNVLSQAKKVKEIAAEEPFIAEEWEKAKRGDQGVRAVYEKAKAIEEAETLPTKERKKILQQIKEESLSPKQLREEIKEAKEEQRRVDIAKKSADLRKKHEEMEVLKNRIKEYKTQIESFNNGIKNSEANLNILTEEITEKYPQWKGLEPAVLITKMSLHYDTLDTEIYNDQLNQLRDKYSKLMKPLRDKLYALEEEYKTQKEEIITEKKERQNDIKELEKYETLLNTTIEKIEQNTSNLEKTKKDLEAVLREYDEKYK